MPNEWMDKNSESKVTRADGQCPAGKVFSILGLESDAVGLFFLGGGGGGGTGVDRSISSTAGDTCETFSCRVFAA